MYKVFLVDDEIVIREGIRNSFPWDESGYTLVGEAPDGELALPMIQDESPDILLTDIRMPFLDGMALTREVRRLMPWVEVVILSGYDDFEYARQAMSMGVKEYLLKPISASELREALDRAAARIDQERRSRADMEQMRRRFVSGNRFLKEKLLLSILMDPPEAAGAQRLLEQMRALGISLAARCYAVAEIAFLRRDGDRTPGQDALFRLSEGSGGIVQVCSAKHGSLALVLGDSEADTEERVYAFARSAVHALEQLGYENILASVGQTVFDVSSLKQSATSARHIRHVVTAYGKSAPAMRIVGEREMTDAPAASPELDVRPLYERLQYAGRDEAAGILQAYAASLGAAEIHSAVAADFLHVEVLMTASRMVRDAGGDPKEILKIDKYEQRLLAQGEETDDDLPAEAELLCQAIDYRDAHGAVRGSSSVARARAYLAEHFSDPNLMLQDVSAFVGMSGSRFSTVFAQETGITYTEYLTALRLGKAKELLTATAMRSSEIAYAVGYNDPHYFSYLFKKSSGETPSEFRKSGS